MKKVLALLLVLVSVLFLCSCGDYDETDLRTERGRGYEDGFDAGYREGYNDGAEKAAQFVYDELSPGDCEDALAVIMNYADGEASYSELCEAVASIRQNLKDAKAAKNYYK